MLKGTIRKLDLGWVIDYVIEENFKVNDYEHKSKINKSIGLHPEDTKFLKSVYKTEEFEGIEVDFEIVMYEPTKGIFLDFGKIIYSF